MDETLLRDILNRLNDMPSRFEFNNLLSELKEYVTKSEFNAEIRRVNERIEGTESSIKTNTDTLEEFKRNRLPAWVVWVAPPILGGGFQIAVWYFTHGR